MHAQNSMIKTAVVSCWLVSLPPLTRLVDER
jgi:hypothetical protein